MSVYNEAFIHIDLEDGECLAEFVNRSLVDSVFMDGGEPTSLVPASMIESVAHILGLDHGSTLNAAIEEALSSHDSVERAIFFEGLGCWIHSASYIDLAALFADSTVALRGLNDENRKRDVAERWAQQRAVAAEGNTAQ